MHPAYIKAELEIAGLSQAKIAEKFNVSRTAVMLVIAGRSRSQRIEKSISKSTGVPLQTLWPQWYPAKHTRKAA